MEAVPARTLHLTERVPRVVRLAPADVEHLLRHPARPVEVAPTARPHRYRLTPRGVAGVLVAPTCRIAIRPKIPLQSLHHLLGLEPPAAVAADRVAGVPASLPHLLAGQLALRMRERADAGLHRGYREERSDGHFLRGRLDLAAQVRQGPAHRDRVHCIHDTFTVDVSCNRVPRTLAEELLALPVLGEQTRAVLGDALAAFAEVAPLEKGLAEHLSHPAPPDYAALLDLCRLIVEALAPGGRPGERTAPAFLLEMERVFERYLTRGLGEVLADCPGWRLDVQPGHTVSTSAGGPDLTMRPDVVLRRRGAPVAIVDAKWKRLDGSPLVREDVHQMLAYCAGLGIPRGVLVYPGPRSASWVYPVEQASCTLEVHTLGVTGSPDSCRRSLARLGRALRRAPA